MKCPKCGYIGFENADKCRNCGYDFSLVADPLREIDLPLRREEPLQAPADFEFRTGETPRPEWPARPSNTDFELPPPTPHGTARELPLFRPSAGPAAPLKPASVPPAPAVPPRAGLSLSPPPAVASPASSGRAAAVGQSRQMASPPRLRPVPAAFDFKEAEADLQAETPPVPRARAGTAPRAAGSVARAIAGLVDAIILLGLDAGVLYFTLRVCRLSFPETTVLPLAPLIAFFLLLDGGYLIAFTAVGGQTIGKMATSLKVISEDGARVVPAQAAVRAIGCMLSCLPAGLGFVPGLFGPSRRALHDRLANTRVVRT